MTLRALSRGFCERLPVLPALALKNRLRRESLQQCNLGDR
jgi:hypothetical protein